MRYVCNSFSTKMLKCPAKVVFVELELVQAQAVAVGAVSAIGHESTARVLSKRLGIEVPVNRILVHLEPGDQALVCEVALPRLREGEILPEEQVEASPIRFILAEVKSDAPAS